MGNIRRGKFCLKLEATVARCAILLCVTVFGLTAYSLSYNTVPYSDEAAIFNEANWITEHGGALGFVTACVKGQYPYHDTNPAVHLLVSPVLNRTLSDVRLARLVEIVFSAIGLVLVYALSRKRLGTTGAVVLTLLLAASRPWILSAPIITVEPLIYAFFFGGWITLAGLKCVPGRWFGIGVIVGLAWLIKASALLLPIAATLALLLCIAKELRHGLRFEQFRLFARRGLQFAIGFALIAWPLLADRFQARGNPFYCTPSVHMWLDDWEQVHLYNYGLQDFGPKIWFATHSLADAVHRLQHGMMAEAKLLTRLFDSTDGEATTKFLLVPLWLLPAAWGLFSLRGFWARLYTATTLALTFLAISWYVLQAERYTGVLGPLVGFLAVFGARNLVTRWRRTRRNKIVPKTRLGLRFSTIAVAVAYCLIFLGARLRPENLGSPFQPILVTESYARLVNWLGREVVPSNSICLQTPGLYPDYQVHWLLRHDELFLHIPPFKDFRQLDAFAAQRNVRYLILEKQSLQTRRWLFEPYAGPKSLETLLFGLPGWRPIFPDPAKPSDWRVYVRKSLASHQELPNSP